MGRLDNIIARNRRPHRVQERVIVSMALGAVVLVILALAVFTDLGLPPEMRDAPGARDHAVPAASGSGGSAAAPAPGRARRVDGVLLGTPRPAR